MKLGGNTRAKRALESVLDELDLKTKYESPAAEAHRQSLKADVYKLLGLPLEETPTRSSNQTAWSASNDPRFRTATAISSDQFYNRRGPAAANNDGPCPCPCTIL